MTDARTSASAFDARSTVVVVFGAIVVVSVEVVVVEEVDVELRLVVTTMMLVVVIGTFEELELHARGKARLVAKAMPANRRATKAEARPAMRTFVDAYEPPSVTQSGTRGNDSDDTENASRIRGWSESGRCDDSRQ